MPRGNNIVDLLFEQLSFPSTEGERMFLCGNTPLLSVYGYYSLLQEPGFNALLFYDEIASVQRLLRQLPPKEARICALYFIDDYSYVEIARFTNLSPTTVKNHIAWSMIILRNYMTKPKAPV